MTGPELGEGLGENHRWGESSGVSGAVPGWPPGPVLPYQAQERHPTSQCTPWSHSSRTSFLLSRLGMMLKGKLGLGKAVEGGAEYENC